MLTDEVLVLFGRDFGDIIRPAADTSICTAWNPLPACQETVYDRNHQMSTRLVTHEMGHLGYPRTLFENSGRSLLGSRGVFVR